MRSVIISDTSLRIVGLFYDLSAVVNPCEDATGLCTGKREFCEITPAAPYYECKECCRPKKPAEDRLSCECKCGHYLIIGHYRLEHIQHKLLIMLIVGPSKTNENRFKIYISTACLISSGSRLFPVCLTNGFQFQARAIHHTASAN